MARKLRVDPGPFLIVCVVAAAVSGMTLFSGFGLGTVLVPMFAVFLPLHVAIAASAFVHLANNAFKVALVGRFADCGVVRRFGLPAALASVAGALALGLLERSALHWTYQLGGRTLTVTPVKAIVGVVIVAFACVELLPRPGYLAFDRKYLPLGGLLSGFFGGLSGNQGALRSAFLLMAGLGTETFIGTGVVVAALVDAARIAVYGASLGSGLLQDRRLAALTAAASFSAFLGSFLASRLTKRITLRAIHLLIGALLVMVGVGMAAGLL